MDTKRSVVLILAAGPWLPSSFPLSGLAADSAGAADDLDDLSPPRRPVRLGRPGALHRRRARAGLPGRGRHRLHQWQVHAGQPRGVGDQLRRRLPQDGGSDKLVLGGNFFYDHRKTRYGSHFDQLGLGFEAMADLNGVGPGDPLQLLPARSPGPTGARASPTPFTETASTPRAWRSR